jgi:predicted O-methyltransferase YrrM
LLEEREKKKMSTPNGKPSSPLRAPPHILALLERLHTLSLAQEPETNQVMSGLLELRKRDPAEGTRALNKLMSDKFVALDKEKCEFVYQLILSTGAKNVVEAGTSYGVSTIYLALAVGQNFPGGGGGGGGQGKVIATENEPEKISRAKGYWEEAGEAVTRHVELREGNLLTTLQKDLPEIDLLLLDSMIFHFEICIEICC